MGKYIVTFRDFGIPGERSTAQFPGPDVTSANIDTWLTETASLRTALEGITLGTVTKLTRVLSESPQPDTQPASQFAQRETKWLVRYHDAITGKKATLEVPTADLALLDPNSTGKADMTNAAIVAFVTAFEAFVVGPDGNAAEVDELVHVGRNN